MASTLHSRVKGLATIALLKSQYDAKQDHIEMFVPFVIDTTSALTKDDFTLEELRSDFRAMHGLALPAHALQTVLGRLKRRGFVRREAGRYFRIPGKIPQPQIPAARAAVDAEHAALAAALREFAASKNRLIPDDEGALALILTFLEENQLGLLLDEPGSFDLVPPPTLESNEATLVARFLTDVCLPNPQLASSLQRMLEGFVLQNVLLLRDIGAVSGTFRDLVVIFDTRFLFGALGLTGLSIQQAGRELLDLLKVTGARLAVFEPTVAEMKRVLSVYEQHLGSSEGIRKLFAGPLTRHFVSKRYAPSDIREAIALLERNIGELGLSIRRIPKHDARFTLNEDDLAKRIAGAPDNLDEPRVIHDVQCVTGVVTLRAGRASDSWDNAHYVFATTTGLLVKNVMDWHRSESEKGVPPAIHVAMLSNLAWIKRPAAAPDLKLHELVALCSAALQPSRKLWSAFIQHLRKLEQQGTITSDEAAAVVASELTETLLLDMEVGAEDPDDVDAETLTEVIERVRETYSADADRRVAEAEARAAEAERAAQTRIAEAERTAAHHVEVERQRELRSRSRIDIAAGILAWAAFVALIALVVAGTALGLVKGVDPASPVRKLAVWIPTGVVAVIGLALTIWGGSLVEWRMALRDWIRRKLVVRLLGPKE
jgi:hypothetical protein